MKCYGLGNLTRDPELSYMPNGKPVCNCSIACNRKYKDKDGNQQEQVDFVDLEIFGVTADNTCKYCKKGRQVYIEGRLKHKKWTTPAGESRSKHTIVVERIQFLSIPGRKPGEEEPSQNEPRSQPDYDDVPF